MPNVYISSILFCRFLTSFALASNPSFFCVLTIQYFSTQYFASHLFTCSVVLTQTGPVYIKLLILSFWIVSFLKIALRETNFKAGPPLQAILVIFGRRALIFFCLKALGKNEK